MTEQNDNLDSRAALPIEGDIFTRKRKFRETQVEIREHKWWGRWLNRLRDKSWWRYLIHIPHGMGAAWALFVFPFVGIGWLVLIIAYQYLEDWRIEDKSYIDMRGYMIGYAIVSIIRIIWHYLT
jgi:hypothetical protein